MKKINSSGFVLAETLVVTVFLLLIFAMIYSNFYPLIGEYEKREVYDTVDGKYAIYWIKKMIEDADYQLSDSTKGNNFNTFGYIRFECNDLSKNPDKRDTCVSLVKALEIDGCDSDGNFCEAFITKYQIGGEDESGKWFKDAVKGKQPGNNYKSTPRYRENCTSADDGDCQNKYKEKCNTLYPSTLKATENKKCLDAIDDRLFKSGFADYVNALPDYTYESLNNAKYRVIVSFHNLKDNNNYYSYATIEVNK